MAKKIIKSWINGAVQEIEVDDIVTVENEISVEDRLNELEDKPVITNGNFLVGNGTKDYVEMTPSEALRHIDGASIATLTTAEYDALVEAEKTNANVLYMLTDAEEETIEVDEDSFKFKEDLTITYPLGKYQTLTNGVATIGAKNKTFKEVWNDIFCDDADGIVSPSISLSISGSTSAEVGETVSPVATLYEYAGSYTYGSTNGTGTNTGVEFTSRKISCSTTGESTTNSTLSLGTITYKDSSQTYSCSANASHGASPYTPKSKLGVEKTPIASGSCTDAASKTFTGYRKMFMGCLTSGQTTFTSADIRDLDKVSVQASRSEQPFTVPSGTKQIVVAYPASLTSDSEVTPTFKYEALGQWFTEESQNIIKLDNVTVEGANNYEGTTYYVYSYTHTGTFASATNYKITI